MGKTNFLSYLHFHTLKFIWNLVFQSCKPHEFQCENGKCIDSKHLCDGVDDCSDRSDEKEVCGADYKMSCKFDNSYLCGYVDLSLDPKYKFQRKGSIQTTNTSIIHLLETQWDECYHEDNGGIDYEGNVQKRKDGISCQKWNIQYPTAHPFYLDRFFPTKSVNEAENYCRLILKQRAINSRKE